MNLWALFLSTKLFSCFSFTSTTIALVLRQAHFFVSFFFFFKYTSFEIIFENSLWVTGNCNKYEWNKKKTFLFYVSEVNFSMLISSCLSTHIYINKTPLISRKLNYFSSFFLYLSAFTYVCIKLI